MVNFEVSTTTGIEQKSIDRARRFADYINRNTGDINNRNCHSFALYVNGISKQEIDHIGGEIDGRSIFGLAHNLEAIYQDYFSDPVTIKTRKEIDQRAIELSAHDLCIIVDINMVSGRRDVVHSFVPVRNSNNFLHSVKYPFW